MRSFVSFPDLGNIFVVAEIEEDIQVGVQDGLAQVQVFEASLEDVKDWNDHLLESTNLLVGHDANNDLLQKLHNLFWLWIEGEEP